ncbi:MAG: pilin [bacterium]|nr:pilin [bacterium]
MFRKLFFIFIGAIVLLLPLATYAAILPQPTGSCPTICQKWDMSVSADMKTLPKCAEGMKIDLTCNKGKCVAADADGKPKAEPVEDDLPCNYTLDDILQSAVNFVNFILGIAGSLALLMVGYGGYGFFTSMGNPEAINKAKSTIIGGFIGLLLILGAVIFVQFGAILIGANVKPSGEVVLEKPGAQENCSDKKDSDPCGGPTLHRVCYQKVCVNECDYLAATDENYYGFSCQAVTGVLKDNISYITVPDTNPDGTPAKNDDGTQKMKSLAQQYCKPGVCPSDTGFQCCITVKRLEEMQKKETKK